MNIGVCVPLNPNPDRQPTAGPVRFVTDDAQSRAEQALLAREASQQSQQQDQH